MTYKDHPDDLNCGVGKTSGRAQLLDAASAQKQWSQPVGESQFAVHLLGTCRMGTIEDFRHQC